MWSILKEKTMFDTISDVGSQFAVLLRSGNLAAWIMFTMLLLGAACALGWCVVLYNEVRNETNSFH